MGYEVSTELLVNSMKIDKPEDLRKITTSDLSLVGIEWVENGRDIELTFEIGEKQFCSFICKWASNIKINLKTKINEGGNPFTWDIYLKQTEENSFDVQFDFASNGEVFIACNELIYK